VCAVHVFIGLGKEDMRTATVVAGINPFAYSMLPKVSFLLIPHHFAEVVTDFVGYQRIWIEISVPVHILEWLS
jgi:hypothetical protein